jgi:tRNA A37 methylthiotransferase MiaB
MALKKRWRLVGTTQEVLVEEDNIGRTRTNYKVNVRGNVLPGEIVPVRITNAQRATLEGVVEDAHVTFANFREEESQTGYRAR